MTIKSPNLMTMFQHTAARRRLVLKSHWQIERRSFNTQPPEGGWRIHRAFHFLLGCFNTQPPEGGWAKTLSAS